MIVDTNKIVICLQSAADLLLVDVNNKINETLTMIYDINTNVAQTYGFANISDVESKHILFEIALKPIANVKSMNMIINMFR